MRSRTPPDLRGRCPRCYFPEAHCLCAQVPRLETRLEVVIIRHALERHRTSNTARWAALALPRCRIVDYALDDRPADLTAEVAGGSLLFPTERPSAPPSPPPGRLVVVDGSWSQARRMLHRLPELRGLPRLSLPPPPPGSVRLRTPNLEAGMSTLEAIAQALALCGEPQAAAGLEALHRLTYERATAIKGRRWVPPP